MCRMKLTIYGCGHVKRTFDPCSDIGLQTDGNHMQCPATAIDRCTIREFLTTCKRVSQMSAFPEFCAQCPSIDRNACFAENPVDVGDRKPLEILDQALLNRYTRGTETLFLIRQIIMNLIQIYYRTPLVTANGHLNNKARWRVAIMAVFGPSTADNINNDVDFRSSFLAYADQARLALIMIELGLWNTNSPFGRGIEAWLQYSEVSLYVGIGIIRNLVHTVATMWDHTSHFNEVGMLAVHHNTYRLRSDVMAARTLRSLGNLDFWGSNKDLPSDSRIIGELDTIDSGSYHQGPYPPDMEGRRTRDMYKALDDRLKALREMYDPITASHPELPICATPELGPLEVMEWDMTDLECVDPYEAPDHGPEDEFLSDYESNLHMEGMWPPGNPGVLRADYEDRNEVRSAIELWGARLAVDLAGLEGFDEDIPPLELPPPVFNPNAPGLTQRTVYGIANNPAPLDQELVLNPFLTDIFAESPAEIPSNPSTFHPSRTYTPNNYRVDNSRQELTPLISDYIGILPNLPRLDPDVVIDSLQRVEPQELWELPTLHPRLPNQPPNTPRTSQTNANTHPEIPSSIFYPPPPSYPFNQSSPMDIVSSSSERKSSSDESMYDLPEEDPLDEYLDPDYGLPDGRD
ncbi:MAG: hypothetical protein M1814_003597 [Vezdaea aestivalis]|nr:MAG: hypothetical protein M1814_003597 [Vezdaea aestivalis]